MGRKKWRDGEVGFPLWVHRGVELDFCTGIKLEADVQKTVEACLVRAGKVSKMELNTDGKPRVFGERPENSET